MDGARRPGMPLTVVVATVGGMGLIDWAVTGVLPGVRTAALVIGVVLVAFAAANARPAAARGRGERTPTAD